MSFFEEKNVSVKSQIFGDRSVRTTVLSKPGE